MLGVYGPEQPGKISNTVRALTAANDGGRWVFVQSGEPFPFEQVEQYQARRVRDRFTFDMLKDYLRHLRLAPFEEDFYLPPGSPAWLVQKTGPFTTVGREYTLEQARAARGRLPLPRHVQQREEQLFYSLIETAKLRGEDLREALAAIEKSGTVTLLSSVD